MSENAELPPLACIVLAAGQGTRMKSDLPKVLHPVAQRALIAHVMAACADMGAAQTVVVTAPGADAVARAVAPVPCAVQATARGTGDAVRAAEPLLKDFRGDILILYGDSPLVTAASLNAMRRCRADTGAGIVVAGFTPGEAGSYGRLQLDENGLNAIVEAADATPAQRAITLCNGGFMLFDGARLWGWLGRLRDDNARREFYLTDCVALARADGVACAVVEIAADEVLGVNSRVELAQAEAIMQRRLRRAAMEGGATLTDPDSVFLAADTVLGRDVTVGPHVVFGPGVRVGDGVEIRAFCHIEQAAIERNAVIGPFARLRPGTKIGAGAHIGNFVEVKNSDVGAGAKANHLTYVGDAEVGAHANLGAGTITANYDGFTKSRTIIGARASTGANSVLVAPVSVGVGAIVAAGSTITETVPDDALAVARARQNNRDGWARRLRDGKKN